MTWFKMMAPEADSKSAKIELIGQLGRAWYEDGGVDLQEFHNQVKALGDVDSIDVSISSPGGSYVVGAAIYNLLSQHPAKVVTRIIGEASSAASLAFLAGDERHAPANAIGLIHDPAMPVLGNFKSAELRKVADDQDTVKRAAMSIYTERTGMSEEDVSAMMSADTILTGADMHEKGFATHLDEPMEITADADATKRDVQMMAMQTENDLLKRQSEALTGKVSEMSAEIAQLKKTPDPATADEIIQACETAGFVMMATDMIKGKAAMSAVNARLAEMKGIRDFCMAANIPPDSVVAAAGNGSVEVAKAAVAEALAAADVEIRGQPGSGNGGLTDVSASWDSVFKKVGGNK